MKHINEILSGFKNLKEYSDFMQELSEKSASGEEIARGMSQNDKSKDQKARTFLSKEVKKNANGSATEKHYGQVDANMEQVEEPAPEPEEPPQPLPPGAQVKIGNKMVNDEAMRPKTVEINVSGEKDKLEMKPKLKRDPRLQR